MVEGHGPLKCKCFNPLSAYLGDPRDSQANVLQNNLCRHSQRSDILRPEEMRLCCIALHDLLCIVRKPIDFDGKLGRRAVKINHIDSCWVLTAEFETIRSLA